MAIKFKSGVVLVLVGVGLVSAYQLGRLSVKPIALEVARVTAPEGYDLSAAEPCLSHSLAFSVEEETALVGNNAGDVQADSALLDNDNEANMSDERYAQMERAHDQIERFSAFTDTARKDNLNPLQVVNNRFEEEAVDYDWAANREDELFSMFDNQNELQNIAPLSVNCKTTNCKVVLAVESERQAEELSTLYSRSMLESEGAGMPLSVSHFFDSVSGELVFYLSDTEGAGLFK
ncbi:hypothetical protein [Teredinibacter purpureus]|jgi:hypothetical protein|uniref:hypothetical protein n=1 Tax=Teredinibacter purpureus TaxID=2731756 RepID=UPI00069918FE|nr:hypothetical protein [Teredinibacter purpureus]